MIGSIAGSRRRSVPVVPWTAVPILADANGTSTDQGGGVYRYAKTAGGGFTQGPYSEVSFSGDFLVEIGFVSNFTDSLIGIDANPTGNGGYASVDYGVSVDGAGNCHPYGSGVEVGSLFARGTNKLYVKRVDGVLGLYVGSDRNSLALRHNFGAVAGTFGVDGSCWLGGATLDIKAGPLG